MTSKSDLNTYRSLHEETAKAIRRGEKFSKSLERVVAQREPNTSMKPLLKALGKGLSTLRHESNELERLGWPKKFTDKPEAKSTASDGSSVKASKVGNGKAKPKAAKKAPAKTKKAPKSKPVDLLQPTSSEPAVSAGESVDRLGKSPASSQNGEAV
jgi:hypothetical protein